MKILSILGARPQIIKHAVIEEGIKKLYGKKSKMLQFTQDSIIILI